MSNKTLKLQLWKEDPRCYYCRKPTIITDLSTIDHIVSRYCVHRWVRKKQGQRRRVLSCYECNQRRNNQETLCLSRAEVLKRSQGFSLSPRGKPKIIKPLPTAREAEKRLNA